MAHESPNPWTITPPAVLLGARFAVKELLGRSASEIVYGTTLRLPGEFSHKYNVDAHTDLDNYSNKLRVAMSRPRLCSPCNSTQNNIFQFKESDTCSHAFFRRIAIAPPLTAEKQRKTQTNAKNSKNTATVRREPALKHNSEKKRAEPKATRSVAVQHGTNLATTSQHNANRVNLPQQFTPYVAPHSRIPAVSRAKGSAGGLRTYSLIPLHLQVKTPNSNEAIKPPNVQNNSNIAKGDQIVPDATVKQTRAGRKIQTPARFVQMVHTLVAPNDIYCGTSHKSRNNHNL